MKWKDGWCTKLRCNRVRALDLGRFLLVIASVVLCAHKGYSDVVLLMQPSRANNRETVGVVPKILGQDHSQLRSEDTRLDCPSPQDKIEERRMWGRQIRQESLANLPLRKEKLPLRAMFMKYPLLVTHITYVWCRKCNCYVLSFSPPSEHNIAIVIIHHAEPSSFLLF